MAQQPVKARRSAQDIMDLVAREAEGRGKKRNDKAAAQSATSQKPRIILGKEGIAGGRTGRRPMPPQEMQRPAHLPINFEIYDESHPHVTSGYADPETGETKKRKPDDSLVRAVKNLVNSSGLSRRDLYSFIGTGDDALFSNRNQVYNLEYGLRTRPTITADCAEKWAAVCGMVIDFTFIPVQTEVE